MPCPTHKLPGLCDELHVYVERIRTASPADALMIIMRDSDFVRAFFPSTSSGAGDMIVGYLDAFAISVLNAAGITPDLDADRESQVYGRLYE